ncbi:septum formation initiator family protein [uncultured Mobiluncus sp.]|uniref:FtsB family cell division protein n=1 Tax=uncultured Mobiluncus sp. TaxID=293425 RepID=UPI0025D6D3BD|nr:septum formation initiator family protein [uncultured Mobiluncus sp.]
MKRPSLKPRQPSDADKPTPHGSAAPNASARKPRKTGQSGKPGKPEKTGKPVDSAFSRAKTTPRTPAAEAPGSTRIARILTLAAVALAVFLVVFSPLRSWMDQQQQARSLAAQIAQVKAQNAELEAEIKRYQDPEYISRQARERLGYVKPGEITYVVVDPPGAKKPQLTSGWTDKDTNDLPWFRQIVVGLEVAGAAPAPETTPGAEPGTGTKTTEPPASPGKTNPEPDPKSSNAPTHN